MAKAAIAKVFSQEEEDDSVLFQGVLQKVGQKYRTWKRRTMVLRKDLFIYYYKDINKNHLGVIPLADKDCKVREGLLDDCNWPRNTAMPTTIVIETKLRTFYTVSDTLNNALLWREEISKVLQQQAREGKGEAPTTPGQSRALKSKVKKDKFSRQATRRYQEEGEAGQDSDDGYGEDDDDDVDDGMDDSFDDLDGNDESEAVANGHDNQDNSLESSETAPFAEGTNTKEIKRIITRDNTLLSDQSD